MWYDTILPDMLTLGFKQSDVDPCLLNKEYSNGTRCDIGLYVDDIWVIDDAQGLADADFARLAQKFKFTLKPAHHFLNLNVTVEKPWRVKIDMKAYITKMADTYVPDWRERKKQSTPSTEALQREYDIAHKREHTPDSALLTRFRGKVGALIYSGPIRPDAQYTVSRLSRAQTFATAALESHLDDCIVYLAQTAELGLTYDGSVEGSSVMTCETDSDWAVGHSTSAFAIYFGGAAVSCSSKRQPCVATSSTEAELIAASSGALELVGHMRLASELGVPQECVSLLVDNSGAVELSRDRKSCHRSRHVDRRFFKVRELAAEGWLQVVKVATELNSSDVLTKSLDVATHWRHVRRLMNADAT